MPKADAALALSAPVRDVRAVGGTIFGSFWIDEAEFALPVSAIREVVNEPERTSTVPLAPPCVSGFFNLRGMVIPIVDLRTLLGFAPVEAHKFGEEGRKVAIIEDKEHCIGILFDRSGEVLHDPGTERVDFRAVAQGTKGPVIDGVIKLENGDRVVQLLDPEQLLNIDGVPQAGAIDRSAPPKGDIGKRNNCITFQLGHISCALDLRYVQEVRDMPPVDGSVFAHGHVIGTATLRGSTIPVVDFRSFIGGEGVFALGVEALSKRKLLVMRTEGGLIGLMVYAIESILPYFDNEVMPFSKLAIEKDHLVRGCIEHEGGNLVTLLDHDQLIVDPELVEAAATSKKIHKAKESKEEAREKSERLQRRTFIIFTISGKFAMDTRVVSEVINKPETMLAPAYALNFVEGVLSLRGELITLINPRRLYGFGECNDQEPKVLIFLHDSRKYAILVDTVDEIVMTTDEKVTPASAFSGGCGDDIVSDDAASYLHVSREDQTKDTIMVIDAAALLSRCAQNSDEFAVTAAQ